MKECDEANTLPVVGPTHDCFTKNVSHVGDSHYCKALLFNFVYFETIAKWVSFGLVPFVLFIFAGFVVCGCMCVKEATAGSAAERNETCSSRV
ncbi:hypothetical protein EB796_008242 [Bugula neritina]|uniref:Uncharacterized protein n=1 Tax=Bugula neritina TaxID=10212 RepID=A0A7J7K5H6_BUGNE|nr:hypothetical protein EB796_008242 [Bugula neritina]